MKTKMVISPKELEERIRKEETPLIKRLETYIDKTLLVNYEDDTTAVTVKFPYEKKPRQCSIDDLLKKYRKVGWKAEVKDDREQGEYMVFKYQKQKRRHYSGYN